MPNFRVELTNAMVSELEDGEVADIIATYEVEASCKMAAEMSAIQNYIDNPNPEFADTLDIFVLDCREI